MTGAEHYKRAQQIIAGLDNLDLSDPGQAQIGRDNIAVARVHATLALASATRIQSWVGTEQTAAWMDADWIEAGALPEAPGIIR